MKDLVIGVAQAYSDWNALEPFVRSFEMSTSSADLMLFLDNPSKFTLNRLKDCKKISPPPPATSGIL